MQLNSRFSHLSPVLGDRRDIRNNNHAFLRGNFGTRICIDQEFSWTEEGKPTQGEHLRRTIEGYRTNHSKRALSLISKDARKGGRIAAQIRTDVVECALEPHQGFSFIGFICQDNTVVCRKLDHHG